MRLSMSAISQASDQTNEKPTTPSGDPKDGTGEDNHSDKKQSPQQTDNDEDHG
jgi:hypothetical protein